MLLPNASVSSAVFISDQDQGHGRVTSTYLAPCTQGPLMITALLMALMMVISIYWLILKWVAKVGNDVSEILWR